VHILLIHQAFAALDEPGGTRHHELARYLASQGHRVTIIASPISYLTGKARSNHIPWSDKKADGELITIIRAYTYPSLHKSFAFRLVSFFSFMVSSFLIGLRINQVDLVWGTSPPIFQGLTAWIIARLKGIPFLFEVRDLWPEFAIAVGVLKNPLLIRLSQWLERFLYQRADLLVVNSPGFVEYVKCRGAKKVELVPNGTDTNMFRPDIDGRSFRQIHDLGSKFLILYAGAHGLSNDLGTVLRSAKELLSYSEILFVLLGDGKDKPALQEQATKDGLSNLLFLPPISKMEMPNAIAAADACLAILKPINMYKTTYPNKVFDYMASGKPVILAIDGVIREVVEKANGGIAVHPGDSKALSQAVLRLDGDRGLCENLGRQGRSYVVANFDRSILAEKLLELMLKLTV
jgi:glycosyltransferase involved in cell wall biosynthesis